ncbi:MAG TPA: BrnA antitoxin family protein [Thermomicrobiales bacterium]|nr:BrnA antitoxin family protein [Thermomicrobiales bacterium]
MQKTEHIVRYTADELDEMIRRGEDQTDWARVNALTDEEIEASIDYEDEGEFDFSTARPGLPEAITHRTVMLDPDVVAWFKAQGPEYQTHMNAVLRDYVEARKRQEQATASRQGS